MKTNYEEIAEILNNMNLDNVSQKEEWAIYECIDICKSLSTLFKIDKE
jgi:hypothetical protein